MDRQGTGERTGRIVVRKARLDELYACLAVRRDVFIVGQGVPEDEEVDGRDAECTHFIALDDQGAVGTARLLTAGNDYAKAQRVAVIDAVRGKGVGAQLMSALEDEARAQGFKLVRLAAQVYVIPFYAHIGYTAVGPVFLDAGIEHRDMYKRL